MFCDLDLASFVAKMASSFYSKPKMAIVTNLVPQVVALRNSQENFAEVVEHPVKQIISLAASHP